MSLRLMAVGDIFLQTRDHEQNLFAHVKDIFSKADVVFGNLEVPLTNASTPTLEKAVTLRSSPDNVVFLKEANISVVNLAHNHICDFGIEGAIETLRHLQDASIRHIGVGMTVEECLREVVLNINDITVSIIGFFMYSTGISSDRLHIAGSDPQLIRHRIAELKRMYDFVVVSFHWGRENVFYPSPEQQTFARCCIDEGASVVIGHHPHVVQGIEEYDGGVIFYSLGNFNLCQNDVTTTYYNRLSCIADISFAENKVTYELIPAMIDDNYYPRPIVTTEEISRFNAHMKNISSPLASGIEKWWWFGEIAKPYLLNNGKSFLITIRKYGIKHLYQMLKWLTSPFVIKCYVGLIYRYLRLRR